MTAVDLVDVAGGNVGSVRRCLERLHVDYRLVNPSLLPDGTRPIILPGVGAFGAVMESLRKDDFDQVIVSRVRGGTPYLGICVGMQILFDESDESPGVKGLSLVPGRVVKYDAPKVPQIGWNAVVANGRRQPERGYVYFVNSYYPLPDDQSVVSYFADYYGKFCAALEIANITAFQFHPEKSGEFGATLLEGWLNGLG